jgi:hypothetical protein
MSLSDRVRTSLIIPKLIVLATVGLFVLAASMAYVIVTAEPSIILEESAKISDSIKATVNP